MNEALRETAARGQSASLVYVDASELPDSYLVVGRYRIEAGSIRVKATLFKGETATGDFTVQGNPADLDNVAAKIVGEAERLLH